jgi:formylglycine-generating enzyme required for sulfatase activity
MTDDDMAQIPGGTFRMGSDTHYPDERPAHSVTVDSIIPLITWACFSISYTR